MAFTDYLHLFRFIFSVLPYASRKVAGRVLAIQHQREYVQSDSPRTVAILGGSFAGIALSRNLSETLPSGWRVVLIERNSHFNFTWAFPRFTVLPGHEQDAFIPYEDTVVKSSHAPEGVFKMVRDSAVDVTSKAVVLESGDKVAYDYLVMATGSSQPFPSRVNSRDKEGGCVEIRSMQQRIQDAHRIAVIGGGPVGLEIATDIKSFFSDKEVTLVHSRDQLLRQYKKRLHDRVLSTLEGMDMKVILGQRAKIQQSESNKTSTLIFSDGRVEEFDLVIPCTGQTPNSALLRNLSPDSILKETGAISVKPTLQITDPAYPNVFALGDVAETGGPKMATACARQADVVSDNINLLIHGKEPSQAYKPLLTIEGALKLTLGKDATFIYCQDEHEVEAMLEVKGTPEDFDIARCWGQMGVTYKKDVSQNEV